MPRPELSVFVPNGDSRQDTVVLLVGTADEFGVSQKSIKATRSGFYITEELADLLDGSADEGYSEDDPESSGNRAEENDSEEEYK